MFYTEKLDLTYTCPQQDPFFNGKMGIGLQYLSVLGLEGMVILHPSKLSFTLVSSSSSLSTLVSHNFKGGQTTRSYLIVILKSS